MTSTFLLELDDTSTLAFKEQPFTGSHSSIVWPSGIVLAKWLWHEKQVAGKRVIDVGSGLGPVGLTAARLGSSEVWLTDVDEEPVLKRLRDNAELNQLDVKVAGLDWNWPSHGLGTFDVVVTADTLFTVELAEPLAKTLASLCTPQTLCLVAYEKRDPIVIDTFLTHARQLGFVVKRVGKIFKHLTPQQVLECEDVELVRIKFIGR